LKKTIKGIAIFLGVIFIIGNIVPLIIPIPPLITSPPVALADQDSLFTNVDGIKVHFKKQGKEGPAIILLHGFGASVFSWREVMDPLAEIGTVYAYDRPGFGLTERPIEGEWQGLNPYSQEGQVKMLADFMDSQGIENAILVGNSVGGTIATAFSLKYPDRVQALVEVDAAIYPSGEGKIPGWAGFLLNTPQAERIGPWFMRQIRNWGPDLIKTAWHDPKQIPEGVISGYQVPLMVDRWDRGLFEILRARGAVNLSSQLKGIQVPVLVITGDDDRIVPTDLSVKLASEIPNAELKFLPNCGHVPQEECPLAFLDSIIPFINQYGKEE
jgi:pimeloyl-ACP methyl ester carboxylesterase